MSDSMDKAVYQAAKDGDEAELRRLIGRGGSVNWHNPEGWTALIIAACYNREGCVRLLLESKASVNATNIHDRTALHFAAFNGSLASATRLLEGGADLTLRDKDGQTALDVARSRGKSEVVALLSQPRWDKAAADKAAADKAAADKAAAEKAAAAKVAAEKAAAAKAAADKAAADKAAAEKAAAAKAAADKAAADKASADKAAADKAAAEELRRRATALGLLQVLTPANIADEATLKKSIAFCDEHGVTSVSDMVKYDMVDDFVRHLGLKTLPGKKLRSMLQTPTSGLAGHLSDRLPPSPEMASTERAAEPSFSLWGQSGQRNEGTPWDFRSLFGLPAAENKARRVASSSSAPPFFLASAPVSVLDRAKRLVESRGGEYAAGDKDDIFNSMTLGDQESWKVGWKGKVEMLINILKKHNPGQKVTALAIAGGPACDWERGELHNTFCSNHRELVLKQLGDMEDLQLWLDRYHPASPDDDYAA